MHIFMATPILKNYQPGFVLRVKFPSQWSAWWGLVLASGLCGAHELPVFLISTNKRSLVLIPFRCFQLSPA
jgi:hypothetical protein